MAKIDELALVLSDRYGLNKEECGSFVAAMFDVVCDELSANPANSVKIKGLGTFKVLSVGAREGVSVNNGERILIEGYSRISFTPEVMLRDRINRPFLQFETVVLNDGVDLSDTENEDAGCQSDVPQETAPVEESDSADSAIDELACGNEQSVAEAGSSESVPSVDESGSHETAVPTEEENATHESVSSASLEEDDSSGNVKPSVENLDSETDGSPVVANPDAASQRAIARQLMSGRREVSTPVCKQKNPRLMYWLSAASFVLLLFIGAGMYLLYRSIERKNAAIEKIEHGITPPKSCRVVKVAQPAVRSRRDVTPPSAALQHTTETSVSDYNYDPRVRTGAYIIVGTDCVVKVRAGQTLESVSKAYLGAGMECYVEVFNGGVSEVKAGDTLKIPKLKLKPRH